MAEASLFRKLVFAYGNIAYESGLLVIKPIDKIVLIIDWIFGLSFEVFVSVHPYDDVV